MEKIKIALIGCGRISGKHFASLNEVPEFELVAVCDTDKEKADKAAKEQNCKAYYDYDELLKDSNIDIVDIMRAKIQASFIKLGIQAGITHITKVGDTLPHFQIEVGGIKLINKLTVFCIRCSLCFHSL